MKNHTIFSLPLQMLEYTLLRANRLQVADFIGAKATNDDDDDDDNNKNRGSRLLSPSASNTFSYDLNE